MDYETLSKKALLTARNAQLLLDEIRAEYDAYKLTVHADYQAMSDSMVILGDELIELRNLYNAHVHSYTDVDSTGTIVNKITNTPT